MADLSCDLAKLPLEELIRKALVELPDGSLAFQLEQGGVKEYTALLTQAGTAAPTAVVLKNSLSGTPALGYLGVGVYSLTLASEFPADKVAAFINIGQASAGYEARIVRADADTIAIYTYNAGVGTDALLSSASVTIKVYP